MVPTRASLVVVPQGLLTVPDCQGSFKALSIAATYTTDKINACAFDDTLMTTLRSFHSSLKSHEQWTPTLKQ